MGNQIYLYELPCYQRATEKQVRSMYMSEERFFDLGQLPNKKLQEEMEGFLLERGGRLSVTSMARELPPYNLLCCFINEKEKNLKSFREKDLEVLVRELKAWLLKNGYLISYKGNSKRYPGNSLRDVTTIAYLKKLYKFLEPADEQPEREKDVWTLKNLGIPLRENPIRNIERISFYQIPQPLIREETKTAIYMELKHVAVGTVLAELASMRRFSRFLADREPQIGTCGELQRDVIESYLTYLNTEVTGKKSFRSELIQLKTLLGLIGKAMEKPELENLFFKGDIPGEVHALYRAYSDEELIRLNKNIVKMNEQVARALIIHQMLGTRISDTLTLPPDCLYQKNGQYIIKIKQVKSRYYEKPVADDVAALIQKAIDYTKERYGKTEYIFVSEADASRPFQYSMIQRQVLAMISEQDLRDDNGELFGFNTHLFRHTYGRKLTEMHLDDYTIGRLLGHANVASVKYYRKMSDQALADETREMRETMDEILLDVIKGWEKYE